MGVPRNWRDLFTEVAHFFSWSAQELDSMPVEEVLWWHTSAVLYERKKDSG